MNKMKHLKMFESFGSMGSKSTLAPMDISRRGESVIAFTLGDAISVILTNEDEASGIIRQIRKTLSNPKIYQAGSVEDLGLTVENRPGIAYVVGDPNSRNLFSFETSSFEDQTPMIDFWITPDSDGENPNDTGGYETSVFVLERGMVLTANAGAQIDIEVQTIDGFLRNLSRGY